MSGSKDYVWYIYMMEYYAAERKELLPFGTAWMELESIMLSEISQAVKEKYHMISSISGTQSVKQISKQNRTRDIEIENILSVTRGEVGGDNGGKRRKGFQEHVQRTHGQNQRGVESMVGSRDGWGQGEWRE